MVDRDTLRMILDRYMAGEITQKEVSDWAYDIITGHGEPDDRLVTEILYNLVTFDNVGFIFEQYGPSREKLEYFLNWLENKGDCNWDQYNTIFDPGKLM